MLDAVSEILTETSSLDVLGCLGRGEELGAEDFTSHMATRTSALSKRRVKNEAGETKWSQFGRMEALRSFGYPKMLRPKPAMAMEWFRSNGRPTIYLRFAVLCITFSRILKSTTRDSRFSCATDFKIDLTYMSNPTSFPALF